MNPKILVPLCAVALLAACGDRSHDTGVGGNTSDSPEPAAPTTATPGTPTEPPPPAETPPMDTAPTETPPADQTTPPPNQ